MIYTVGCRSSQRTIQKNGFSKLAKLRKYINPPPWKPLPKAKDNFSQLVLRSTIEHISPGELQSANVQVAILDLDGTLRDFYSKSFSPKIIDWLTELQRAKISTVILSNNPNENYLNHVQNELASFESLKNIQVIAGNKPDIALELLSYLKDQRVVFRTKQDIGKPPIIAIFGDEHKDGLFAHNLAARISFEGKVTSLYEALESPLKLFADASIIAIRVRPQPFKVISSARPYTKKPLHFLLYKVVNPLIRLNSYYEALRLFFHQKSFKNLEPNSRIETCLTSAKKLE